MLGRFANVFKRFYKDDVRIIRITDGKGYSERGKQIEEELAVIKADLQPLGGELAEREYGVTEECQMRMFCGENDCIEVGNYVEAAGRVYRIIYVAQWSPSPEVLLQFVRMTADAPYDLVIGAHMPIGTNIPLERTVGGYG